MTDKNKDATEELIRKFTNERNELIRDSNKSNDSKFNDLKAEYEALTK
jgi:hypothetical protein